jgi:hypothetical protein
MRKSLRRALDRLRAATNGLLGKQTEPVRIAVRSTTYR